MSDPHSLHDMDVVEHDDLVEVSLNVYFALTSHDILLHSALPSSSLYACADFYGSAERAPSECFRYIDVHVEEVLKLHPFLIS